MGEEKIVAGPRKRWGTWEELILGSAVLRHGNRDWDVIASELRVRTMYPVSFTPQVINSLTNSFRLLHLFITNFAKYRHKYRTIIFQLISYTSVLLLLY